MRFAYLIEPPFNYVERDGHITGCDVELARYISGKLGVGGFEPVETEFAELLSGLSDGRWRMTTGLFGTDERRKIARFSRPIWALPDGLLVRSGNPRGLSGYHALATNLDAKLAVIRDQFQHRSAVKFGVREDRIAIYETYSDAATAVRDGEVDAYASVGRAHGGFIEQNPDWGLELVLVPTEEKPPAYGSFAVKPEDTDLLNDIDKILESYLGSDEHREMVAAYGFSQSEIDLVVQG